MDQYSAIEFIRPMPLLYVFHTRFGIFSAVTYKKKVLHILYNTSIFYLPNSRRNSASSRMATPRFCALVYLLPGSVPATT